VRFEVTTAVYMTVIFKDVMLSSVVEMCWHFRGMYYLWNTGEFPPHCIMSHSRWWWCSLSA